MAKALIVIAQNGYQDVELKGTRDGLIEAGFEVELCSKEARECMGKFEGKEQAVVAMRDADVSRYDRFAFIGGPGAKELREDDEALDLARRIAKTGKVFGAICIAPTILAAAGVLDGKEAAVWNEDGDQGIYVEQFGVFFTGEHITIDGNIITADGPEVAVDFGKKLAAL